MFGFGKKNKKNLLNEIHKHLSVALLHYGIGRSMLKHKIETNELRKDEKELFEATYLFGVANGANYYVDPDWKTISYEEILDIVSLASFENKIFNNTNKASQLFSMVFISQNHNIIKKIASIGTRAAINCIAAAKVGDGGVATKSMNIDYFSDKKLAKEFKIYFQKYLSKEDNKSEEKALVKCQNLDCSYSLRVKKNTEGTIICPKCSTKFYLRT